MQWLILLLGYTLQADVELGTFTLMQMVNIVVRIYILQDEAGLGKCTLMSMVNIGVRYTSCMMM